MQQLQKNLSKYKNLCIFKDRGLLFNEPFLKQYISSDGSTKFKLSIMKCVKNKLVECPSTERVLNKNEQKLDNNLQRARAMIFELAYCNQWDYFFTRYS